MIERWVFFLLVFFPRFILSLNLFFLSKGVTNPLSAKLRLSLPLLFCPDPRRVDNFPPKITNNPRKKKKACFSVFRCCVSRHSTPPSLVCAYCDCTTDFLSLSK